MHTRRDGSHLDPRSRAGTQDLEAYIYVLAAPLEAPASRLRHLKYLAPVCQISSRLKNRLDWRWTPSASVAVLEWLGWLRAPMGFPNLVLLVLPMLGLGI